MDNVEVYFGHSKSKKQWDEMQWGSADNYTDYKESRIIPIIGAQKIFSENITNFDSKQFSLDKKYQHNEYYKKNIKLKETNGGFLF